MCPARRIVYIPIPPSNNTAVLLAVLNNRSVKEVVRALLGSDPRSDEGPKDVRGVPAPIYLLHDCRPMCQSRLLWLSHLHAG